jgi:group I intron endonuclease
MDELITGKEFPFTNCQEDFFKFFSRSKVVYSGIYCIKNNIKNKKYIGCSIAVNKRWKSHFEDLIRNKHPNKKMQEDFNVDGEDNFVFIYLESCKVQQFSEREEFYISLYDSKNDICGYNTRGGRYNYWDNIYTKTNKNGNEYTENQTNYNSRFTEIKNPEKEVNELALKIGLTNHEIKLLKECANKLRYSGMSNIASKILLYIDIDNNLL